MTKPVASIRLFGKALLFAVAVLALPGCDLLTVSQTGRNIRQGNDAVQRGEIQKAVQYYETALDGTMLSAEAHYRLGLLYEDQLKNEVGALHHFERYLELAPQGQFSTDVKGYVERLRLVLASRLAEGSMMPAREATRLKNENLELQKQLADMRKGGPAKTAVEAPKATVPAAQAKREAAPSAAMIVAATPPPTPAPAATPEPQVRRAEPVNATPAVAAPGAPPAAAASPATPAAGRTHTVQKGETFASIARKYYGHTGQWPKIADANKDVCPDPTKLKPGMVLRVP